MQISIDREASRIVVAVRQGAVGATLNLPLNSAAYLARSLYSACEGEAAEAEFNVKGTLT